MKKNIFVYFVFVLCLCSANIANACDYNEKDIERIDEIAYLIKGSRLKESRLPVTGIVCSYYSNGNPISRVTYKNGRMEGIFYLYHENGDLWSEGPYKNGMAEGIHNQYYKSGKLKLEIPFKNDKVEGIEKGYYESGKLQSESPYKNGKLDGKIKIYRENGKPLATVVYKNGSPVSGMCHSTDGITTPWTNAELYNFKRNRSEILDINCD